MNVAAIKTLLTGRRTKQVRKPASELSTTELAIRVLTDAVSA